MKAARSKAELKHLKTKRKRAKDKKKRRAARAASDAATAMAIDGARGGAGMGGGEDDGDDDDARATRGDGDGGGAGRMRQSAVAARKRELRARITELKSKRGKIGKKNFGKSEERKRLTLEIKRLERERASVCASTANAEDAVDAEKDLVRADEDAEMVM